MRALLRIAQYLPGIALLAGTAVFGWLLLRALIHFQTEFIGTLMCAGIWLVIAWLIYMTLPEFFKKGVRKIVVRRGRPPKKDRP